MVKEKAINFVKKGAIIIAVLALWQLASVLVQTPNVRRAIGQLKGKLLWRTTLTNVTNHVLAPDLNGSVKTNIILHSMPTPKGYDSPTSKVSDLSLAIKRMGLERAEDHSFQSPYIVTPNPTRHNNSMPVLTAPGRRKKKRISLHAVRKYNSWFFKTAKHNNFRHCPYSECEVDTLGELSHKADLVLFVCGGLYNPPRRPKDQLWALYCYESARYSGYPDNYASFWKDVFNITISYRLDADIPTPFDLLHWRDSTALLPKEEYVSIAKKKSKGAAWFVRNCRKDRWNFVKEMQKYLDIDIYGSCSKIKCPHHNGECWEKLNTTYKFYLSFENSFCKDYVTEKLFKIFNNRTLIIPVGKGGLDYDKYFPSNTFVNGNKFATAKDLALYLKELGNDIPRYASMLQEKDKLVAGGRDPMDMWCGLCEYLHTNRTGVHKDIRQWTHGNSCGPGEYNIS